MYFGTVEKPPRLAEFKMEIPNARIAQKPPKNRDLCKLMVLDRKDESIHHMKFKDISDFFKKMRTFVFNPIKLLTRIEHSQIPRTCLNWKGGFRAIFNIKFFEGILVYGFVIIIYRCYHFFIFIQVNKLGMNTLCIKVTNTQPAISYKAMSLP